MQERKMNAKQLQKLIEERGYETLPENVQKLVNDAQQNVNNGSDRLIFDCCTITLAPESVVDLPFGLIDIGADYFFLECFRTTTEVDASTPTGIVEGMCMADEVKAVGHINYVASFSVPTYYNNGNAGCEAIFNQPFSCTGSVAVNNTLCYVSANEEDVCPEFCNGNTRAFAFIADVDYCNPAKAIVTIGVLFILPDCEDEEAMNFA